jgi:NAD(P)-dependent dehydrogenase (short-subunit alcohol dehydrogenase family)
MRHILVTGASRGIGFEFVRQLLARGDRVYAGCRKPPHANALNKLAFAHPGHLTILPLDVAKPASIVEFARELGIVTDKLDALINNAGVLVPGERFGELDAKALDEAFRTNAAGPLLVTQALTPYLERGERATVLNIGSALGSIAQRDGFSTPSYAISKAALNMATRLSAHALAERGITVLVASPGWVRTAMGGAQAEIEPAEAVKALLRLLDSATPERSGGFFDSSGDPIPW